MNTFKGLESAWDEPEEKEMYKVGDEVRIYNIECEVLKKYYEENEICTITKQGKDGAYKAKFKDGEAWYIGGSACDVKPYEDKTKGIEMTPCEEMGYKVGDRFTVVTDHYRGIYNGDEVVLEHDDGTNEPLFRHAKSGTWWLNINKDVIPVKKSVDAVNKYTHKIKGVNIDVYDVLLGFNVICPATQHAIKKLLMAGNRGHKNMKQDLEEARDSVTRAIELLGE